MRPAVPAAALALISDTGPLTAACCGGRRNTHDKTKKREFERHTCQQKELECAAVRIISEIRRGVGVPIL